MNGIKTKILTVFISILIVIGALSGFIGCQFDEDIEQVDKTRTQLYVATYGGGIGTEWLKNLKIRFEEYYKDEVFQAGRKGVQVFYQEDKDKYMAGALVTQISHDTNEVFFVSGDELDEFISGNKLLDISDIVSEKLTKYGETRSIEQKLSNEQLAHFKRDGKFYSLPDIQTSLGVMYDIDLFEKRELYFAKNGAPSEALQDEGFFEEWEFTGKGEKSAGPDGIYTTYDDGMPATYDEFEKLLQEMKSLSIDALIWTGQYADTYSNFFCTSFWADYHGLEEASILYNAGGNGTSTKVVTGFDNGVPIISNVSISPQNYKEAGKQAGRYYALKAFETIIRGGHVSDFSYQSLTHVRTQDKFLTSSHRMGEKPIAMIIEGTWWENEAEVSGIFKDNVTEFGDKASRKNRSFGILPLPKATQDMIGNKRTILGDLSSSFINANINEDKIPLAKLFLQFSATDESLSQYTRDTGLPKAMSYQLSKTDYEGLTTFSKQYWDMIEDSDILYKYVPKALLANAVFRSNNFNLSNFVSYNASGIERGLFVTEAKFNNMSAKDYFEGIYKSLS